MNYCAYKFTDQASQYYFYFISPFTGTDDIDLVAESIEHYISNAPSQMNQFLVTVDFDQAKIEPAQSITPLNVINGTFPADDKCMNISNSFISLIPPPKPQRTKKEAKPKAEKPVKEPKIPKPRGKKAVQTVAINVDGAKLDMNN